MDKHESKTLQVTFLAGVNMLVVRKLDKKNTFFAVSEDGFAISVSAFAYLLKFLIQSGFVSPKLLEGILEEYYTN